MKQIARIIGFILGWMLCIIIIIPAIPFLAMLYLVYNKKKNEFEKRAQQVVDNVLDTLHGLKDKAVDNAWEEFCNGKK